jgi:hypothetical protein
MNKNSAISMTNFAECVLNATTIVFNEISTQMDEAQAADVKYKIGGVIVQLREVMLPVWSEHPDLKPSNIE